MLKFLTHLFFLVISLLIASGCNSPAGDTFARIQLSDVASVPEEKLLIVDCLTPGQVRKMGAYAQTISPRRALRTSIAECEAAGGEYVSTNTNPQGALKVWLPFAADGDIDAQVNVGEIYERGLAGAPDYAAAIQWYEKAAAKGNARAIVNLASLYERGAGTKKDIVRARALYRQASGLAPATERPRITLIDPPTVLSTLRLRSNSEVIRVKAAPGPFLITGRVSGESPIRSITVNDQARQLSAQGLFNASVVLDKEPTQMSITATDQRGVTTQTAFMLALESPSANANTVAINAPQKSTGLRYALVIANQNYRNYEKLETPHADGQAIKDLLEKRFGFDVSLLKDVTRREVLAALNTLRAKASASDQVLIYYAGHGEIDGVTQRGYWIPVDAEQKNASNWISIIDVTDQLAAMQARSVFVIADSCYSGTLTRSASPEIDAALSDDMRRNALDQVQKTRSRIAITSGGLEPVVDGGGGRHSIFGRSLIDVLTNLQSAVEAQQLFNAINARFAFLAQRLKLTQQPEYAPIRFAGHESGDFVLTPVQVSRAP